MIKVSLKRISLANIICLVIMGLVITLFQGPLFVQASDVEVKTVKIGYYENEIFEEGAEEGAVKSGYAYEYYMKLSEYTGWKYEYVYGSFNDLYQKLIDGDIDMLAGLAYKEDREDLMSYPELPMGAESYNFIKHKGDDTVGGEVKSINGHTIGVLDSAMVDALDKYLSDNNVKANVVVYTDSNQLTEDFDDGVVDILAVEGEGTNNRTDYEVLWTFGFADYYICVNKDRTDLLEELNSAQTSLLNYEPYYSVALSSKYHGSSVSAQALSCIEAEWLEENDSITVGYLNNYLPYSDTDEDGQVNGVVKDVVPAIFSAIEEDDITVSYVGYDSYDEMMAAVDSEEVDIVFPVGGSIYYSEQNGIYQTSPLVTVNTELVFENVVVNPNAATFALNSNISSQFYYVNTNFPDAKVVYYDSVNDCLDAVLNHEADCTLLNGLRASSILKNYRYNRLSSRQLSERDNTYIGVKIGNEGLLRLLNRGINILDSDYTENIAYKYTDELYSQSFFDWLRNNLIAMFVVFMAIIVVGISVLLYRIRQLRLDKVSLQNSNNNQMRFIDNIANSFKEPISNIWDVSNMACQVKDDEKLLEKGMVTIAQSSEGMKTTVDKIIDISLLDKGKIVLVREKVNVVNLTKEVESAMLLKADKKSIAFNLKIGQIKNKDIVSDKARLMQVLKIVLDNAINYTRNGGQISMTVQEEPCSNVSLARMVFTIKDNGIGMSEEFKKIAFNAFTKENLSSDMMTDGAGLGLTIAKLLVEIMGGYIDLQTVQNQGTEVKITIDCKIDYS